jgi:hypothetical protein
MVAVCQRCLGSTGSSSPPSARRGERRVVARGGDHRGSDVVRVLRRASDRPWPPPGRGGGSAARRSAGGAGVGQALVALRRAGVCDPDLVGGVRGDRATGRADRAGSGGDRSSCRSAEHSVAQAARDFGVLWHAAMAAVRDHGRPPRRSPRPPRRPSAVGLDETSFLAGTAQHPTMLVTGIVDLDEGRLVDVLPARRAIAVTD